MPSSRNLANYPELVKSFILEAVLQPPVLNQHNAQLQSKYLSLESQISVVLTIYQRNISLQQTQAVSEYHNHQKFRVVEPWSKGFIYNTKQFMQLKLSEYWRRGESGLKDCMIVRNWECTIRLQLLVTATAAP